VTGFVEDVMPMMHRCTAMIVPLLSGSGMRIKIVEAMAASLPVISTSIGIEGIKAIRDVHALVADQPNDIRSSMKRLLDDGDLHQNLVEKGKDLVKNEYEWKSIAEQFIGVYESLLQKQP
jgi:glycosyltransferase involved in cell wall biosynthesis